MDTKEFAKRRKTLMQMIGHNGIVILPAATEKTRNSDVHYRYRQDSDFHYLTGFPEPEAVAVLVPQGRSHKYILFCRDKDKVRETWDGRRAGQKGAIKDYAADEAYSINKLDSHLSRLLGEYERVFYTMGKEPDFDHRIINLVNAIKQNTKSGQHPPQEFVALDHYLHDMRLFKSPAEIKVMKHSARIAVGAHKRAMQVVQVGMNECEIEAEFVHEFKKHGADISYSPIVGGGDNSCILHYNENNQILKDGDLLLIDAGCEYDLYASDITRTFPVNGKFSDTQRAIYDIVLSAQEAAFAAIKPGNSWIAPHEAAVKAVAKGLKKVGLLKGTLSEIIKSEAYFKFFMHKTGHWLGMDVHDVGDYKVEDHWRVLEPGMVLTVEPGIYIPAGSKGVAKKWWNIGVRIEDDVRVTRNGYEILSKGLPRCADDIEALMAKGAAGRAKIPTVKSATSGSAKTKARRKKAA
ncbi:MAG: M24 family metallopeptidase [Gammaproteobacteria bacterium]|nr:M24 family metallopeptidase [Gammaproteobacteria bacterium]